MAVLTFNVVMFIVTSVVLAAMGNSSSTPTQETIIFVI